MYHFWITHPVRFNPRLSTGRWKLVACSWSYQFVGFFTWSLSGWSELPRVPGSHGNLVETRPGRWVMDSGPFGGLDGKSYGKSINPKSKILGSSSYPMNSLWNHMIFQSWFSIWFSNHPVIQSSNIRKIDEHHRIIGQKTQNRTSN